MKTSGGKGLHVVLPIEPRAGWDEAKKFTQPIAEAMAKAQPERYVAIMSEDARGAAASSSTICSNGRGATAVARLLHRALPAASVSTRSPGTSSPSRSAPIIRSRQTCAGGDGC